MRVKHRLVLVALAPLLAAVAACGGPQDEACARYVDCQRAYDEAFGLQPTDVTPFEEGGQCWINEQTRSQCHDTCVIALEELRRAARDAGHDLAECQ